MRPLAPSEKTLFLILCGGVFLSLNMLGVRSFLQACRNVQQAILTAQSELATDQNWLLVGDTLHPAMIWMNAHPMPQMANDDDANALLLKTERDAAEKAGLKVTEENLLPSQTVAQASSVAVSAKLAGPFEGVVHMLFALQSPTAWRSVDKLILKSDAQPPNVVAELELRQYFHQGPASAPPSNSLPQAAATPAVKNTP
jgi:hypothetical protein